MKTKIGIIAAMLMGSVHATTWLPVSPDSISVSDSYSSEYTLPTGVINEYTWDALGATCEEALANIPSDYLRVTGNEYDLSFSQSVCMDNELGGAGIEKMTTGYNVIDLEDLYGQQGSAATVNGTLIGVLDTQGKAYVLINGSVDSGFTSEKVQIDPKVQLGGSLILRPTNKLTLVGTITPKTVLGGDKTEQDCDGRSCHQLISEDRGGVVVGQQTTYEEIEKNISTDYNLGATYKFLEEADGNFIDLSGKLNASGSFDEGILNKSASLTIAKTVYQDDNTLVQASVSPSYMGGNVTTGVGIAVQHQVDNDSSLSLGISSNYANGDFGAINASVGINHIAEDGSEIVIGISGNFIDGESALVPSLAIYPEEGFGFSISPIGFGITEKFNGRRYNHSLNPYAIIIQALLGQRTILDLLTVEEVETLSQGKSIPQEEIVFDLPSQDGLQLVHDRESQTVIGFDENYEVQLRLNVLEVGGYLFIEDLSGAFDSNGKLYKF